MEIKVRVKCSKCSGAGFIEHPQWAAFKIAWDKFKEDIGRDLTGEDVDKILTEFGVENLDRLQLGESCKECGTYGYKESWISVDDLTNPVKQIFK